MGKIKSLTLAFDKGTCEAGESLTGCITLVVKEPVTIESMELLLYGKCKVHWSTRRTAYASKEQYIDKQLVWTDIGELKPDVYKYTFSHPLPHNIPSSFTLDNMTPFGMALRGYVKYLGEVKVRRKQRNIAEVTQNFWVRRPLDLNLFPVSAEHQLHLARSGSMTADVFRLLKHCGSVSARFSLDKGGYVPGESILINATVENNSNVDIQGSQTEIIMATTLHSTGEYQSSTTFQHKLVVTQGGCISAHTHAKWDNVLIQVPDVIPTGLEGCNIIDVAYLVKFSVVDLIAIESTIIIGSMPVIQRMGEGEVKSKPDDPKTKGPAVFGAVGGSPLCNKDKPTHNTLPEVPPPSYDDYLKGLRITGDEDT